MKTTLATLLSLLLVMIFPAITPLAHAAKGGSYNQGASPRNPGQQKGKSTASSASSQRPNSQPKRTGSRRAAPKDFPANNAAKNRRASVGQSALGAAGTRTSTGSATNPTAAGWTAKPRSDQAQASTRRMSAGSSNITFREQPSR